jgi:hypothetical protein
MEEARQAAGYQKAEETEALIVIHGKRRPFLSVFRFRRDDMKKSAAVHQAFSVKSIPTCKGRLRKGVYYR